MTVLVAVETLLLVLLVVLVVGLLRSHAEILRRLGPVDQDKSPGSIDPSLPQPAARAGVREGHDVLGTTLAGDAVKLGLGSEAPPTLLAFLSSGCLTCERFWGDLRAGNTPRELPRGVRIMPVTKDGDEESPSRLAELAGEAVPVVLSSSAWADYGVPGAPYFVYVQGGDVHGEGSATSWQQITSLLRDAIADGALSRGGERRTREVDRVLAASGIGPDHPSLYPGEGS
jgi:hypothetical protein